MTVSAAAAANHDQSLLRLLGEFAWWMFLLPLVLFSWRLSHFQYDIYLPGSWPDIVATVALIAALVTVIMLGSTTWFRGYPKPIVQLTGAYIIVAALQASLDQFLGGDAKLMVFFQAVIVALLMIPIISDERALYRLIRLNFVLGTILIALNTVPVLHWLGIISLPYTQVPRVGGEEGLFQLDPLHFGIFGLTENLIAVGQPLNVARLQGFSLEPIHWAYFVYLALSCGCLLYARSDSRHRNLSYGTVFALIIIHLYFVFSAVALIVGIIWIGLLCVIALRRRLLKSVIHEARFSTWALVLTPGLLIPFILSRIPNIDTYIVAENVLNKGSNWASKIGFLSLGLSLFTRFLPAAGEIPSAGQNLLLSTYLRNGYFLTIPLMGFLYRFVKSTIAGRRMSLIAGAALAVVSHTIGVPPQIFYPAGAMWLLMVVGAAFHTDRVAS